MSLNFSQLSVLVVEDTKPMLKLMVSVLNALHVRHIYTADNAEEGFQRYVIKKPDIVITDWHMVPKDGLELVKQIRNDPASPNRFVPIILMTGYSALPRVSTARDHGVTEFLVKPFSATDLSRRIAYVINKPRDFVENTDFFGPDRRRIARNNFMGPYKRREDNEPNGSSKTIVEIG